MDKMASRLVVVDDADPRVQYGPGWTAHSNVQDNPGNGGPPFQGTEHTADRNTTVSFTFTGTMVRVEGKLDVGEVNGRRDPDFECAIDGKSIEGIGFYTSSANYTSHLLFCTVPDLPDGEHTLTLNAVATGARAISVDQFQYTASPMINIDNERVLVDATSDNARYSSGWESKVRYSYTYGRGESAILDFVGVSVKWYGVAPNLSQANGPSTAGYMVDGGEEVNFTLPGIPEGSPTGDFRNVLMFETPTLSPGRHQLKVTHYGDYLSTPLSLDYVVVQNATIPADSSSGLPTSDASSKSTPLGTIVGGVIGGIAILLLAALFLLVLRRHRWQGISAGGYIHREMSDITHATPYPQDGSNPSTIYSSYSQSGVMGLFRSKGSHQTLGPGQGSSRSKTSQLPPSSSSRPELESREVPPPQYSDIVCPHDPPPTVQPAKGRV